MATATVRLQGRRWADGAPAALSLTMPWGKKDRRVVLPWLPEEIERSGFARTWEQQPRPGRRPLSLDTGRSLRSEVFTVRVCSADLDEPVGHVLDALIDAADMGSDVTAALGPRWLGLVNITGLTIRETDWDAAANPIDATVDLELTESLTGPSPVGPTKKRKG